MNHSPLLVLLHPSFFLFSLLKFVFLYFWAVLVAPPPPTPPISISVQLFMHAYDLATLLPHSHLLSSAGVKPFYCLCSNHTWERQRFIGTRSSSSIDSVRFFRWKSATEKGRLSRWSVMGEAHNYSHGYSRTEELMKSKTKNQAKYRCHDLHFIFLLLHMLLGQMEKKKQGYGSGSTCLHVMS